MRTIKIGNLGRVLLLNILMKSEGSVLAIKQIRELIPKVGFNDKELKEMGVETLEQGGIKWKSDKEMEYKLGDAVYAVIKKELLDINSKAKVNFQMLDFMERILIKEDFDKLVEDKEAKKD